MGYPIATDVIRRVQNEEGKCIDVRPWPEAPFIVALMSSNKESEEYFGQIEIAMSTEFARQLGLSLIACADEIERAQHDSREDG